MNRADYHPSRSLRARLMLTSGGLLLVAVAGVAVALAALTEREQLGELRAKGVRFAKFMAPQISAAIAFNDTFTAREVFQSFDVETSDLSGVAVYRSTGDLLYGLHQYPARLTADPHDVHQPGIISVLIPVVSREGPRGTLYVGLSTQRLQQQWAATTLTAAAIAVVALALALPMAAIFARQISTRVGRLADAAARVAGGSLDHPEMDPGNADEIGRLTQGFNVMVAELRRQFVERAELAAAAQERLESLVSARTAELEDSREQYRLIAESTNAIPFAYLPDAGRLMYIGPQAEARLGFPVDRCLQPGFLQQFVDPHDRARIERLLAGAEAPTAEFECAAAAADGRQLQLRWVVGTGVVNGERCMRGLILDISEQRRLEHDLAQAQKLESVGRLAAGVAHEINTPLQFVGDSLSFLDSGLRQLPRVLEAHRSALDRAAAGDADAARASVRQVEEDCDFAFTVAEIPGALDAAVDGLDRVTAIVRSLKVFAHDSQGEMQALDINAAVQSTLVIARNEYKFVADVDTSYGAVPAVLCHSGDINQVLLNVIVNAAHAVSDVVGRTGARGRISVSTSLDGDNAVIRVTDTGPGIPEAIQSRIFDPFFTTKDVGRGSGQGLAIAKTIVTKKHGGTITFDTAPDRGTTFVIRLPLRGRDDTARAA